MTGNGCLTPNQLKVFEELLKELDIHDYTTNFSPGTEVGENFLGYITQVEVKDAKGSKYLIVKCAPNQESFLRIVHVHDCYKREIFVYKKVFDEFKKLQSEKNVRFSFNSYPRLYTCLENRYEEMLIFENVKMEGFRLWPRHKAMDYDHTVLVLKAYARLHALSYAIRDQKPALFKEMAANMDDKFFQGFSFQSLNDLGRHRLKYALEALSMVGDKQAFEKLQLFSGTMFERMSNLMECANPYAVFSHIDCGISNFLFKYNSVLQNLPPSDVCILDFQMSRLDSPAIDLCTFLFSATDKGLRRRYNDLILVYYNTLSNFLSALGSNPEGLLPFSVLQRQLKTYGIVGLFWALALIYVQSTLNQTFPDVFADDSNANGIAFLYELEDTSLFNERARDAILDFDRFGYSF